MHERTERQRLRDRFPGRIFTAFSLFAAVAVSPMMPGCGGGSQPAAPAPVKPTLVGTGTITGRVTLEGAAPAEQEMPLDAACTASCKDHNKGMPRFTRNYVTKDGGLAEVLVALVDVKPEPIPAGAGPLVITQRGCEYEPYVAACQVGQEIHVVNDDPLTHNIHTLPAVSGNKEVNQSQAAKSKPLDFVYNKPEEFLRFKCDVHPWMFSYVSILNHPFFSVTSEDGHYEIKGLPDGKYKVKFKHRKAGEKIEEVEVKDGKASIDVVLKVPSA